MEVVPSVIRADGTRNEPESSTYYEQSIFWTPTTTHKPIPEGYGATSMDLLIFPDITPGPLTPATYDGRSGWEYGHTRLHTLDIREDGLHAYTNEPDRVDCFPDIEDMIARCQSELNPKTIVGSIRMITQQSHEPSKFDHFFRT